MRKIFFLLATITILWSCQNATFTIKGTVADPAFEGATVYLQEFGSMDVIDTTHITNGTFSFGGFPKETLHIVRLSHDVQSSEIPRRQVIILPERGTTTITFGSEITVGGTKINTAFGEYQLLSWSPKTMEERQQFRIEFIRNNIGNEVGKFVLRNFVRGMHSFELLDEVLALADDDFRNEPDIARILLLIENSRKTAVGQIFTDFTLQDLEGNDISLSDFAGRGNYVLVHFWATWCGPCIPRIPYLARFYAQYKERGFEIVSVSFDRTRDAWIAGVERLNMTWTQMLAMDEVGVYIRGLYAIRGIPHSVLLDREGIIIAIDLRDEELDNKLAELMP